MANLFKDLPHLLGTITNLDGAESMRALASIKSELKRRQRIFNEHGVNNIIKYNQLFKSGKASEPLPTLFLISDEFAELKKEQPEFMSELVSVARIGRTLGIKLILATQKPTGVVDDQIWSNSRFKLALKVQDEGDSKEVIKTPDAAYITQAGRAYLQVGNNEVYELFQSAWSGAIYHHEEDDENSEQLVYRINDIGQAELVNKDLSGGDSSESSSLQKTQLDVTIDYIHDLYQHQNSVEVSKPWLPSLTELIVSPVIASTPKDTSIINKVDLDCAIGMVDIPEQQIQRDYKINFVEEGNLAIFSSAGFGKSFTMGTIMLTLACKNSAALLNYYIVDLGNSALIPYVELPHTADYMTYDANEKLEKFMKLIQRTIRERKQLFASEMTQNYETYNHIHKEEPLKAIMIFVDNYDVVKEMEVNFDDFILKVTRDGPGLGIFVVVSASRGTALRYAVLNNFKNKVAQYLYDRSEANTIVGRSIYQLPEVRGRSLVKLENVNMMQVYAPFDFEDNVEYLTKLKALISSIKGVYAGEKPTKIPVLPDVFTSLQFPDYPKYENTEIIAGLSVDDVVLVDAGIETAPYLIIGPQQSGKTNLLELYLNQMIDSGLYYIFDDFQMHFLQYSEHENINYIREDEDAVKMMDFLKAEIENRQKKLNTTMNKGLVNPKQYFSEMDTIGIFIDGVDEFVARMDKKIPGTLELLKLAGSVGIKIIATAQSSKMKGFDDITKYFKTATHGVVLGNQGTNTVFPVSSIKDYPVFGEGLLFSNGLYRGIRIPRFINKED